MNKLYLGIGLGIAVIIAAALVLFTGSSTPTKETQHLSARLDTLSKILEEGKVSATGAELRKLTADANILIVSDLSSLQSAMATAGIKSAPKDIKSSEADTSTFTALKDAKLNGQFDTVYERTLATKLDSTAALVDEVRAKSSSPQLNAALKTLASHLQTIETDLSRL